MAATFSCDGCGKSVQVPIVVGRVLKRDYCEDCETKANAFVEAEEELRKRLVESFRTDRGLLIANAGDGFKLPDIPDAG